MHLSSAQKVTHYAQYYALIFELTALLKFIHTWMIVLLKFISLTGEDPQPYCNSLPMPHY